MLINLLPWREQWHRRQVIKLLTVNVLLFTVAGMLLFVCVLMVRPDLLRITAELRHLQDEEQRLRTRLNEFSESQVLWHSLSEQAEQLVQGQLVLGAVVSLLDSGAPSAQRASQRLNINSLSLGQTELVLNGSSALATEVDAFARQLMSSLAALGWHLESLRRHYELHRGFNFELVARLDQGDV